jgi:hypothetical protein
MPNWTSNSIYAEGSSEQINEFLETIRGENGVLDFNSIIPMPELLKNTGSGACTIDGQSVKSWYIVERADYANKKPEKTRLFTADEEAQLAEIGHRSWYDWSIANWGTKWNACDPEIDQHAKEKTSVRITYSTAWSEPLPILKKLIDLFPHLALTFEWTHEGEGDFMHSLSHDPERAEAGAA